MCTMEGNLQEIIFTSSKHGKQVYQCARKSNWGDRLPISITNPPKEMPDEVAGNSQAEDSLKENISADVTKESER